MILIYPPIKSRDRGVGRDKFFRLIYESRKASFSRVDDYEAVTERGLTVGCVAALAVAAGSRCFPVDGVARGRGRILRGFYSSARRFRSETPREVIRSSACEERFVIHAL